jgi:hypothetical protein
MPIDVQGAKSIEFSCGAFEREVMFDPTSLSEKK